MNNSQTSFLGQVFFLSYPLLQLCQQGYICILYIGSEENSVAFYLKAETDSYYFSLAIWNSIGTTKKYLLFQASSECPHVTFSG